MSVLESLVNLVVSEPLLSSLLYSEDSLNFQPLNLGVHSHLKNNQVSENGSVSKLLALPALGPEFKPWNPYQSQAWWLMLVIPALAWCRQ